MLTQCEACGAQMSVQAMACPQCGHPNRKAHGNAQAAARMQANQGKFLDPTANLRSCLGCVFLLFVIGAALFFFALTR